jgi:molecular chaperone GrpE (heat shock protein)
MKTHHESELSSVRMQFQAKEKEHQEKEQTLLSEVKKSTTNIQELTDRLQKSQADFQEKSKQVDEVRIGVFFDICIHYLKIFSCTVLNEIKRS